MTGARVAAIAVTLLAASCAGDDDGGAVPMVDRIDDAVFAVESHYQAPQDYFEISADHEAVSLVVARPAPGGEGDPIAERASWSPEGGLVEPVPLGEASGGTFDSGDLDFDPDDVFDQLRDELPDTEILDFAIRGDGQGHVAYDSRVRSESGGVLLVLLSGDGEILGSQDATPGLSSSD